MKQSTTDTALRVQFAQRYPSATERDITRMIRFQRGDDYMFHAPPVCTGNQVCPSATPGCSKECLYFQGRGRMSKVQEARIRKTRMFFENRAEFMVDLAKDIASIVRRADKNNLKPCVRLNGTSDIRWERFGIMGQFPDVTFYDYTKHTNRKRLPKNYSLTFSRSETTTHDEWCKAIDDGMNVAGRLARCAGD